MIIGKKITEPFIPTSQELFDFGFRFQDKDNNMILSKPFANDCEIFYTEDNKFIFEDSGFIQHFLNISSFDKLEENIFFIFVKIKI